MSMESTPALARLLFPDPPLVRTPVRLFRWWESHRLSYNVSVAGAGAVTTGVVAALSHLPGPLHGVPIAWTLIGAYGVMANACYSLGWAAEVIAQRWLHRDTYGLGPALYRHGLVFSVGLTLFPAALACLASVAWSAMHLVS
jgi:hypothetical protein